MSVFLSCYFVVLVRTETEKMIVPVSIGSMGQDLQRGPVFKLNNRFRGGLPTFIKYRSLNRPLCRFSDRSRKC